LALNWLCFFAASAHSNFLNPLLLLILRHIAVLKIGFVFSNWFSNPQQCWGLTEIGFDWVCFLPPKTA
jgi:hypothetical protein